MTRPVDGGGSGESDGKDRPGTGVGTGGADDDGAGDGAVPDTGAAKTGATAPDPTAPAETAADPEGVSRFVEAFASQLVEGGLSRMPARVFAALLASEDGVLTSADLSAQLQISPAAVSGAVRYLSGVTMVSREREPGSRRERYRVHRDQWYEMLTDREGLLRRWELTLREGIATVGPDSKPGRRIAETLEFFIFLKTEFTEVMDRWRTHRAQLYGEDTTPAP